MTEKEIREAVCKGFRKLDGLVSHIDSMPLWWTGLLLLAIVLAPFAILGEGSIFIIHDQMDESMMNYVLTARHLGEGSRILPEILGGINASGMQPSAVLFLPLFRYLPAFYAFLIQYMVCMACAFFGMYLCVKEFSQSSILAVCMAGCFSMLPLYTVYGLSQMGIPLLLYAFLCLEQKKNKTVALLLTAFFGLTSHLVYTGYVVLGLWLLVLAVFFAQKKKSKWICYGFLELLGIYLLTNYSLVKEFLFGQSAYISHREELVNRAMPFWRTVWEVFANSAQHAPSYHKYLIIPILLLLLAGAFLKRGERENRLYLTALAGMALLLGIAVFYGICKSVPVVEWKNSRSGFLRYFQMERLYWLYPAAWYLELALAFAVWWGNKKRLAVKLLALGVILLPVVQLTKVNSVFYMNVNQINNGSGITGYISWEGYYAEDLMQELEKAIGRDITTYRVAHLGVSPAPSLMHGFYTVDGYSNNYPLEYKHTFRKVIEKELEKNEEARLYYDEWGNRCYLFNGITGTYWNLAKNSGVVYEPLEFDIEALKELGCRYLFSGGEIPGAEKIGLECMGYYETDSSYWGIWLYKLL